MTEFVIAMRPPNGAPAEYLPKGFGFTAHAHTLDKGEAEGFKTEADAMRRANAYRWPAAFWNSERAHAQRMEEKFRRWTFAAEPRNA